MTFEEGNLKELLNRPLNGTPLEICTEIQLRLQEAQFYEPILATLYAQHRSMISDGDYSISREMLYASMAWFLLKAKTNTTEQYVNLVNRLVDQQQ